MIKERIDKINNNTGNSGNIVPKSREALLKKEFFEPKDNIYRIKKLNQLVENLQKPDFDIELDEMKITKLQKYKDYALVKLTEEELKKILGNFDIKEPEYLNFLGINKIDNDAYSLQLDIFMDKFIRINLKEITLDENVDIIFKMFDKDKDNSISKKEAYDLLNYFSDIGLLDFYKPTLDAIVNSIFIEINKSNRGTISKQELKAFLEKFKDEDITINPFIRVKTSDAVLKNRGIKAKILSPEEEREMERISRKKERSKLFKFWFLNKKMIIWTVIYIGLCITAGIVNRSLEQGRQYATTKAARFFAGIIFLNLALVILFMCLTTITFLSSTCLKFYLPLGDTLLYHEVCGCVLGVTVIVHALIHVFGDFPEIAAKCAPQKAKAYVTVAWLMFANLTGLTGVIAFFVFGVVITLPLIPKIRNNKWEIFYYLHKLFYVGFVLVILHANTPDTKRWTNLVYFSVPVFLFLIELIFRLVRMHMNKTKVAQINYLPSGVVLLEITKPKHFNYLCGQYAQINIPKLAKYQYHPFTFASSPDDDNVYFYIAPVGDWTKDLKKLDKNERRKEEQKSSNNKGNYYS